MSPRALPESWPALVITERLDPHLGCLTVSVGDDPPEYTQFSTALLDMIGRGELGALHPGLLIWDQPNRQVTINGADRLLVYQVGHTMRAIASDRRWVDAHLIADLVQPTPLADEVGVWLTAWDDMLEHGVVSAAEWRAQMGLPPLVTFDIAVDTSQFDAVIGRAQEQIRLATDPSLNPVFGPAADGDGWQHLGYLKGPLEGSGLPWIQPLPEGIVWPGA